MRNGIMVFCVWVKDKAALFAWFDDRVFKKREEMEMKIFSGFDFLICFFFPVTNKLRTSLRHL